MNEKIGVATTQTGGAISLYGWLMAQDPLTLVGILVALLGLAAQVWFAWDRRKRERELHLARMRFMHRQNEGLPEECE